MINVNMISYAGSEDKQADQMKLVELNGNTPERFLNPMKCLMIVWICHFFLCGSLLLERYIKFQPSDPHLILPVFVEAIAMQQPVVKSEEEGTESNLLLVVVSV